MKLLVTLFTVCALVNSAYSSQCLKWAMQYAAVGISGENISGRLTLEQISPEDPVQIMGNITGTGLGDSMYHGLHVHQFGDLSGGCKTTGSHFNPTNKTHGSHAGDLGNIMCADNACSVNIVNSKISLFSTGLSVIGRGVVLHAMEDDLKNMASSGSRLACGVIGGTAPPAA